jgi:hypothetical protein
MFNLQMSPPRWAKDFMSFSWAGKLFDDSSDASKVVSGQLFYLANAALWTYCISWSMRTLYVSYRVISISSSQFNYYVVVS